MRTGCRFGEDELRREVPAGPLFGADPLTGGDSVAFEGLSDPARDLGAGPTMRLHLRLHHVRRLGDGAGVSAFIVDADLALSGGRVESGPNYGRDEGDADREADCGAGHAERAVP